LGGNEFLPACSAPKARQGWEAARPCVSREAKPAKIVSLTEKIFCARPLKELSIFAGFAPPLSGEPLGGLARSARQLVQSEKGSREVYNYSTKNRPFRVFCVRAVRLRALRGGGGLEGLCDVSDEC
jgi:hypothetical protein